jgi:hypothetical protein
MGTAILRELGPTCRDVARRSLLMGHPALGLNGIDFVEYRQNASPPLHVLEAHFFFPLPPAAYGIPANPLLARVDGGTRIVNITPIDALPDSTRPNVLNLEVDQQGDFSVYVLSFGWRRQPDESWKFDLAGVDRQFSVAPVSFRANCPVDFDCLPLDDCQPPALAEPALDYLAKDYASFRQLLLDLVAQRNPGWLERNPSDLGIALLELFAHEGDHLSYFQDAAANEAFLDTVRRRVSAKRHARLVDYAMHDGRNAWTYVHAEVTRDGVIPVGRQLLTRIAAPLRNQPASPGVTIRDSVTLDYTTDPALAGVRVFETAATLRARVGNNTIRLHTWGNDRCCLPRGTTLAHLYTIGGTAPLAFRPDLKPGDFLLLEEVLGAETGAAADADPTHRQVVRITRIRDDALMSDPVYSDTLTADGALQIRTAGAELPLLEVEWRPEDALSFPLCLSARLEDGTVVGGISVARGNIAPADHGRSVLHEPLYAGPPVAADQFVPLHLAQAPLTMQRQPAQLDFDPGTGQMVAERSELAGDPGETRPAVALMVTSGGGAGRWIAVPTLLGSGEFDQEFVADVELGGWATLRTGDDEYGRRLTGATAIEAWYRVGNGTAGNIGAEGLSHLVVPAALPGAWPIVTLVRNPLPARDGLEAETIEEVRQYAPAAFRARQFRAVTADDYRRAALTLDGVAGAVAGFRWTGSWYTVFVGIDPQRAEDLLTEPGGRTRLAPAYERRVRNGLTRFRLAGYDLELRSARYVPLRIELLVCVRPGYFRGEVARAVTEALAGTASRGGRAGFFGPENFSFGQPVYLSRLYAAVEAVEGVDSVTITVFQRFSRDPAGELQSGILPIGPWEIARLDNDRNRMENGVLVVTAGGGK